MECPQPIHANINYPNLPEAAYSQECQIEILVAHSDQLFSLSEECSTEIEEINQAHETCVNQKPVNTVEPITETSYSLVCIVKEYFKKLTLSVLRLFQ